MPYRTVCEGGNVVALSSLAQDEGSDPGGGPRVDFLGTSAVMKEINSTIDLVADSAAGVLITGESGTGKDVVARLIHLRSPRADSPFVPINCAAVPREVFENELFGHESGAFTGATARKAGYLEMASRGTLFLDELAEMSTETQAKLLRVIETKSFRRLGGRSEVSVDVRMVAATNKSIADALDAGELRRDLYYRFSVIEIHLPPLRERTEDIPLLAEHYLQQLCARHHRPQKRFSEKAMEALVAYEWPGNIRELRNVVERTVLLCTERVVPPDALPCGVTHSRPASDSLSIPLGTTLRNAEREIILQTLSATRNNKSKAARLLGLSRKGLYKKLARLSA